jgi:hypothetical protein
MFLLEDLSIGEESSCCLFLTFSSRILFHRSECLPNLNDGKLLASLPMNDLRSKHILEVQDHSADQFDEC